MLDSFQRQIPDRARGEEAQILFRSERYTLHYRVAQQNLDTIAEILDNPGTSSADSDLTM